MIKPGEINEAFLAGVGFDGTGGFNVGYMTRAIRENQNKYLKYYKKGRDDISIPARTEEYSITVFPANQSCMAVVVSNPAAESTVDRRTHAFSHGYIVSNTFFRREMLPFLRTDEIDKQVCGGPAEECDICSDDDIRFREIHVVQDVEETENVLRFPEENQINRQKIFFFAIKAVLKTSHYLVDGSPLESRYLQFKLYDMLPPPLCYQMESCSCGEYGSLFNVLFKSYKEYTHATEYNQIDISRILSEEYSVYKNKYPNIFSVMSEEKEVRQNFYEYMEDHTPGSLLKKEKSIDTIFSELDRCAQEFEGLENCQASEREQASTETTAENCLEVINQNFDEETDFTNAFDSTKPSTVNDYHNSATKLSPIRISTEPSPIKQYHNLSNKRLDDLIDAYIHNGTHEYYIILRDNIFGEAVERDIRNARRERMRSHLENKDSRYEFSSDKNTRYINLIMLAYELTMDEYRDVWERNNSDQAKHGPYDYTYIKAFIMTRTGHPTKLMKLYKTIICPF